MLAQRMAGLACRRRQAKISGPLFDQIKIAARIAAAHERKRLRFTDQEIRVNAKADGTFLEEIAAPDNEDRTLLNQAANRMKLSARGYHRILRVARTLADIDGQDNVRRLHIAEALSYHQVAPSR